MFTFILLFFNISLTENVQKMPLFKYLLGLKAYFRVRVPQVRATLPDESPAAGVPVEVCAAGKCANLTTAEDGLITAVVMSDKANRIFVSCLLFFPFAFYALPVVSQTYSYTDCSHRLVPLYYFPSFTLSSIGHKTYILNV